MAFSAVPGLALDAVKQLNEQLTSQLCQSTAFLGVRDENLRTSTLIGSCVLADLHGTRIIFTAGHVIRDFARAFDDGNVFLSVNKGAGGFRLDTNVVRMCSPGGDHGADAGVLVLPPAQATSYFHFAKFAEPARSTTVQLALPEPGLECIVAGFPAQQSTFEARTDQRPNTLSLQLHARMMMVVAAVEKVDDVHAWLWMGGEALSTETDEPADMGSLNGMSGCGCWSIQIDREANALRLLLHAVHTATTATVAPHLRETPMVHHIRLLASMSPEMESKVVRLWPHFAL